MRLGASREWRKSELVVKDGLVVGDFVHEGADLLVLRVIDVGVQILQRIENRVDADVKDIALVDIVANRCGFDLRDDGLQVLGLFAERLHRGATVRICTIFIDFPEYNVLDYKKKLLFFFDAICSTSV